MKAKRRDCFIFLLVLFCVSAAPAQKQKTMTNSDVLELVMAGFPEPSIVLAIQQSKPDFDTSAKALIQLKNAGVSQGILNAMLLRRSMESEESCKGECLSGIAPNEVTLIDGEKRILLIRGTQGSRVSPLFLVFGHSKSIRYLSGDSSRIRVAGRNPVLEVSLPTDLDPAEQFFLIKFRVKSGRREIEIGRTSIRRSNRGFREEAIVKTKFEIIGTYSSEGGTRYIYYRVEPVEPLPPGEYGFSARGLYYALYDFGIDHGTDK